MSKNDGGSAFPTHPNPINPQPWNGGMTLRQYYAGQALAKLAESDAVYAACKGYQDATGNKTTSTEMTAIMCRSYADALIAELEK